MPLRYQFSLRTLLAAFVAFAVIAYGLSLWRRVVIARQRFADAVTSASSAYLACDAAEVDRLSKALSEALAAESSLPFLRERTVWTWHLERLKKVDEFLPIAFVGPTDPRALDGIWELRQEVNTVVKMHKVRGGE